MTDLSDLVEKAEQENSRGFLSLASQVNQILSAEEKNSTNLQRTGRLIRIPPSGKATVVGDIHGDLHSLKHILTETEFIEEASSGKETRMIFLGDYGDRGPCSPEVYYVVLSLKIMFRDKIVLLQGNHEGPEDLLAHPYDLPHHLQRKFGADWRAVDRELSRLFRRFHTAALVSDRCIMLHGGAPSRARNLDDVAYAYEKHPAESHFEEILWSDPAEGVVGTCPSPRGAGKIFGKDVTDAFLRMLDVHFVVRGHEASREGYKINHGGKILTLFSRKGLPYSNLNGAYLTFVLSDVFDSAWQLEPLIQRF
jgi:protein phosphatase